jgi:AcrR family transcriptional regulator
MTDPKDASDLRARVLAASLALLETEGLAALSLREVARRAGVSHQAPYHHFADREAILAALVTEGFDDLASRLARALDDAPTNAPAEASLAMGLAYVDFALSRPGIFRVMFRPELVDQRRFAEADAAGERSFAVLTRLIERIGTAKTPAEAQTQASLHWAVVHGLATLFVDGKLGSELKTNEAKTAHARQVLTLFSGLQTQEKPVRRGTRHAADSGA